jgi:hypothetical protein
MTISLYQASIPNFIRGLINLNALLEKGAAYAEAKKFDPAVLVNSRLYPDMLPLAAQVRIATDNAKGCAARLAGQEIPVYEDSETTIPELIARVGKTIDYLNSFNPAQIDGAEENKVNLKIGNFTLTFTGLSYLMSFAMPNFYFHVTTAYDILRHNGVDIGKQDFLGKIQ